MYVQHLEHQYIHFLLCISEFQYTRFQHVFYSERRERMLYSIELLYQNGVNGIPTYIPCGILYYAKFKVTVPMLPIQIISLNE